jgi:diacylglycerol kinase family enzyme
MRTEEPRDDPILLVRANCVRVTLIHNPSAGAHGRADLERLLGLLRRERHAVRYVSAKEKDWDRALAEPADLVAVAGGDGTVGRVAKRMAGAAMPLAVLPSGTANNIAHALGMAGRPLEDLVRGWPSARRIRLDVGVAKGPWGERTFVEGVGVGLFARAVPQADRSPTLDALERADAKVAYAVQLLRDELRRAPLLDIRASVDGRKVAGRFVMLEAMSLPYVGPNLHVAPDSSPGDGLFDVVLVGEAERGRLAEDLKSWQHEKPRLAVLPTYRGRQVELEWRGFAVHIDDEIWPGEGGQALEPPARIELRMHASVQLLAPAAA